MRLFVLFFVLVASGGVQSLWPIPRSLQTGSTSLKLAKGFDISLSVQSPPKDLLDAVSRTKLQLINDKLQVSNIPLRCFYMRLIMIFTAARCRPWNFR